MSGRWQLQRLRQPKLLTIALVFFLLIGLHYSGLSQPIESLAIRVIQPLSSSLYSRSTTAVEDGTFDDMSREEIIAYAEEIEGELNGLLVDKAHLQTLVDESGLAKEQQDFLRERSFEAVTAKVVGRTTDNLSQSLVINRGENDGVSQGLGVVVGNGLIVGTVESVGPNSSTVLLTTSFNSLVSGVVQNETQSPGMISGEHNLSLLMEFIPQLDTISVGDLVQTSGAEGGVPHGLVLGQIQEVRAEPGSLFQEASLRPLYDSASLVIVSVLIP